MVLRPPLCRIGGALACPDVRASSVLLQFPGVAPGSSLPRKAVFSLGLASLASTNIIFSYICKNDHFTSRYLLTGSVNQILCLVRAGRLAALNSLH